MALIYIHLCVSLLVPVCPVCVYGIRSEYQQNHVRLVPDFSQFDALLHKTQQGASGALVPRLSKFSSIVLLRKISHNIWSSIIFSQRNKAAKRVEWVGEGGRGLEKNLKKGGVKNKGSGVRLHKIVGLRTLF